MLFVFFFFWRSTASIAMAGYDYFAIRRKQTCSPASPPSRMAARHRAVAHLNVNGMVIERLRRAVRRLNIQPSALGQGGTITPETREVLARRRKSHAAPRHANVMSTAPTGKATSGALENALEDFQGKISSPIFDADFRPEPDFLAARSLPHRNLKAVGQIALVATALDYP